MTKRTKVKSTTENPITRIVAAVNKDFGAGTLDRVKSKGASIPISGVYTTGFETIDAAWGRGGVPWGRAVILHGKEGAGKTTVGLTSLAAAQRAGALPLFIDAEFKLDLTWASQYCGVDLDDLILSQPDYLEQAIAIIDATMKAGAEIGVRTFAVLDSMNACDTKKEYEGGYEDEEHYGPKARAYSRMLPKLMRVVRASDSVLCLVSQIRGGPKGDHIACGNAPKFYSSSIAKFSKPKGHRVMHGTQVVATLLEVEFIKNQVGAPYRRAQFRITGDGPDFEWALLEEASRRGLVTAGSAGWMEWPRKGRKAVKFQGVNGWRKLLVKRPELSDELRELVRAPYNVVTTD